MNNGSILSRPLIMSAKHDQAENDVCCGNALCLALWSCQHNAQQDPGDYQRFNMHTEPLLR